MIAVEAGADALGFVFYKESPRYVSCEVASTITAVVPDTIERVGVFAHTSSEEIRDITASTRMTAAQICLDDNSGGNSRGKFEALAHQGPALRLLPVISMRRDDPEQEAKSWNPKAVFAFLLDSGFGGQPGGTGQSFDWSRNAETAASIKRLRHVIVAGGLTPENVTEAMQVLAPWGVDVSSGLEARPGKKDPDKLKAFIAAVRAADRKVQ